MKSFGVLRRLARILGGLRKDEDGHVVVYFTLMLPVMMGLTGLVLDGGGLFNLHSELQALADASALAGAKELDGTADAITRADDRARNLLSNDPRFSNVAASGSQVASVQFFSALDVATTDPTQAYFIQVTTVTRQVLPTFLRAVGATSADQTSASATAGATYVACQVQPLMLCNPFEPAGEDFHATPGQMFKFSPKSAGQSTYAPGDFGLVDPPGLNSSGANTLRNLLSQQTPNFCYIDQVSPRPGQVQQKVQDGINVRFDMAPNGNTTGLNITPAPNVIRGQLPPTNPCANNPPPPTNGYFLPPDTNMTQIAGVEIGNGNLAGLANYWQNQHGAPLPADVTTRYQAYLRELGLNGAAPSSSVEPLAPRCNGVPAGDYKRRIISVAVVNCLAQGVQGNSTTNLQSRVYAEFFVTQPADSAIYTEFVRLITPGFSDGKLHQVIQLYR
jgi:Flp pilus assembly protein TadG